MGVVLERADGEAELYPMAEKCGLSFVGWLDKDGNVLSVDSLAQDKVYYADYIDDIAPEIALTVTENVADFQTIEIDALDSGSGVKGYYFGTENPLNSEVTFSEISTGTVSEVGTYFYAACDNEGNVAVDEIEFFSFALNLNGGMSDCERILLGKGMVIDLPEPKREGYSGIWVDDATKEVVCEVVADGQKSYSAQWTPNRYTVDFHANGGTCDANPKEVLFDAAYGEFPLPETRYGYVFLGWYTEQTGGTAVLPETIVTIAKNHTLYARWKYNHVHTAGCYRTATCTQSIVCREYDVFEDGAISYTHVCPNCGGVGGGRCGGGHTGQTCGATILEKICGLP